jgi:hypothetical protein
MDHHGTYPEHGSKTLAGNLARPATPVRARPNRPAKEKKAAAPARPAPARTAPLRDLALTPEPPRFDRAAAAAALGKAMAAPQIMTGPALFIDT